MTNKIKEVCNRIRRFRNAAGMTTYEVADRSNLTQSYYSQIENGKRPGVSLGAIMKIAATLNVPVSAIIGESEITQQAIKAIQAIRGILAAETTKEYRAVQPPQPKKLHKKTT